VSFINRAFVSIFRNFGKTILLLLIVFALGCVISGAIAVSQAVRNTDANISAALPPIVTVDIDNQELDDYVNRTGDWPADLDMNLSHDLLSQIGELPYVERFDYSIQSSLISNQVEVYIPEGVSPEEVSSHMGSYEHFRLRGMQSTDPIDISEGIIEIAQGRMFTEAELANFTTVAIVSENFARANNLGIGSTLTLESVEWDWRGISEVDENFYTEENIFASRSYDIEIVGIFTRLLEIDTGDSWMDNWANAEVENTFYVPNTFAREVSIWQNEQHLEMNPDDEWLEGVEPEDMVWAQNIFVLYDSGDIPAFREAVDVMTPDFFTVIDAASQSSGDITAAMDTLSQQTNIIVVGAAIAAVLILSLLITLFIRERKREIGVYLALGERKGVVVLQVMTEVLIVALVAIALSLFAGNLIAGGISESMLRDNLAAQSADQGMSFGNALDMMGLTADVSTEEVLASYNVSLDATTILIFLAVGVGTVVVATIIPLLYILRLNPRKIMM